MNAVVFGIVVLWVGMALTSLLWLIPACRVSRFRNRLWRLRDDLADEVIAGKYENTEQARMLLDEIEATIRNASEVSYLSLMLVARLTRNLDPPKGWKTVDLGGLSPSDRDKLEPRLKEFHTAVIMHAVFGTWSGRTLGTVSLAAFLVREVRGSAHSKLWVSAARQRVNANLEPVEPRLAVIEYRVPGRRKDKPLSAYC